MPTDEAEPAVITAKSQRSLLRLSVNLLLILAALASVWFAIRMLHQRRAEKMLARHDAVLDVIIKNIVTPPANATFQTHPGSPRELRKLLGRTWPDEATRRNAILEFGSPNRAVSTRVTLDIGDALEEESAQEVAGRLADCYADGLAAAGLKRIVSGGGANPAAVWKSPGNDLDVWVDIDVHPDAKSAEVQIIFIDTQRLSLW